MDVKVLNHRFAKHYVYFCSDFSNFVRKITYIFLFVFQQSPDKGV
jgi:hypothetical protein